MQLGPDPILERQRDYVQIHMDDVLQTGFYNVFAGSWELCPRTERWHWQWACGLAKKVKMTWFWGEGLMGGCNETGGYAFARHPKIQSSAEWAGGLKGALEYCLKTVTEDEIWNDRYIAHGCTLKFDGRGYHGGPSVTLTGARQGKSKETLDFMDAIMTAGEVSPDIIRQYPLQAYRGYASAVKIAHLFARPSTFEQERHIELIFGRPGKGKSNWARYHSEFGPLGDASQCWEPPLGKGTDVWFDDLRSSDKYIIIDEFDGAESGWTLDRFKQFVDQWRLQLPVKQGHVWLKASYMGICTNKRPRAWFPKVNQRMAEWYAIVRRFNRVVIFDGNEWATPSAIHEQGTQAFNDFFGYNADAVVD